MQYRRNMLPGTFGLGDCLKLVYPDGKQVMMECVELTNDHAFFELSPEHVPADCDAIHYLHPPFGVIQWPPIPPS
jgi:hypothetical protein